MLKDPNVTANRDEKCGNYHFVTKIWLYARIMQQIRLTNLILGLGAILLVAGLPLVETDKPSHANAASPYCLKDYDRAIELNPYNADAYFDRAYARNCNSYSKPISERKLDNQRVIEDYSRAIELRPTWDYAYISRAFVYSAAGNNTAAVRDFDQAIKLHPYATTYHSRALMRKLCGDITGSIADLDRAIAGKTLGLVDAHIERADLKAEIGDYHGAARDYIDAFELDADRTVELLAYYADYRFKSTLRTAGSKPDEMLKCLLNMIKA